MKPTLAQMEALHWIARLGSFQAAAEHLHLGQPTVSVRIHKLERAIGIKLFERQGRRVRLTAVGAGLALKSERILALAAGVVAPRISTCNSLSVIKRLTVVGAGVSLLPTAIIASELRSGSLRRLAVRPSITEQRLFAAYQSEQAGPGIATILSITRATLARTKFLLP